MLPATVEHSHRAFMNAINGIKWRGNHDLKDISNNFSLPILVRALEGHYGNGEINTFSKWDVIKIHKIVVVDLVLATFQSSRNANNYSNVCMMDDRRVQICFPKDFQGVFQLTNVEDAESTMKETKQYTNATQLVKHLPRLVKVVKCGQDFPTEISEGDVIQIIGEVNNGKDTFLSVKRNKVGAELTNMSLKCKGKFQATIDNRDYTLSELLQLYTLPCTVTLPKNMKNARRKLNIKSDVLKLLNHVGGTLTLQREVASEFYVASTAVQQDDKQAMVLVMSKNADVQFEIAIERESAEYRNVLDSFGTVAFKGIPQELFISEHGMPFVACLNTRKPDKPMKLNDKLAPPTPPPRPIDTFPRHQGSVKEKKPEKRSSLGRHASLQNSRRLPFIGKSNKYGADSGVPIVERIEPHIYDIIPEHSKVLQTPLNTKIVPPENFFSTALHGNLLTRQINDSRQSIKAHPAQIPTVPMKPSHRIQDSYVHMGQSLTRGQTHQSPNPSLHHPSSSGSIPQGGIADRMTQKDIHSLDSGSESELHSLRSWQAQLQDGGYIDASCPRNHCPRMPCIPLPPKPQIRPSTNNVCTQNNLKECSSGAQQYQQSEHKSNVHQSLLKEIDTFSSVEKATIPPLSNTDDQKNYISSPRQPRYHENTITPPALPSKGGGTLLQRLPRRPKVSMPELPRYEPLTNTRSKSLESLADVCDESDTVCTTRNRPDSVRRWQEAVPTSSTPTTGSGSSAPIRIRDLPADIQHLSIAELEQCLPMLNIKSDVINNLRIQQIDGTLLTHMSEEMMRNVLGASEFESTKIYLFAVKGWRPKSSAESSY